MNIVAILQARMSSARLPGKVLKPILDRPMLALQLERLGDAKGFAQLVVATSEGADDDAIAELCRDLGFECFRGALDDVLDRYYQAATQFGAEQVVRLTGDCPLTDPGVIDRAIHLHLSEGFDYTSNTLNRTWPLGLDVEVVRTEVLEQAWREAWLPSEREHVMPFIWRQPERFRLGSLENDIDLSHLRWTVDEASDFEMVLHIYERLHPASSHFTTEDILELLRKEPKLATLNENVARTAGL